MGKIKQPPLKPPTVKPASSSNTFNSVDDIHVYTFNLASKSPLNLALTSDELLDVELRLYQDTNNDGKGDKLIDDSVFNDNHDAEISLASVARGKYVLEVDWIGGGDTNPKSYELMYSTAKPSNLLPTEVEVDPLTGTQTFEGSVGSRDTADLYEISVGLDDSDKLLSLSLTGLTNNANVRLIKNEDFDLVVDRGEVIAKSTAAGNAEESINNALLTPGNNYFVQIYQVSGDTNYTLDLTLTPSTTTVI